MRRGQRRRDWTSAEVRWLLDNAGRVPKRELCRHLRKSSHAVDEMAYRLNKQGHSITLRSYTPKTEICPACGCMRDRESIERYGFCLPCRLRGQLAAKRQAISELLMELPESERATYDETEAETESRIDPRPSRRPTPRGASYYERMKAEEARDLELERWEVRQLRRVNKAAQKRKERIAKKVRKHREMNVKFQENRS